MEITEILTRIIIPIAAIIVTLLTFVITIHYNNRKEYIKTLDDIYKKTFSLRTKITKIAKKSNGIEFHYELDTILNNKKVEIAILDYLTEIENLSLMVVKRSTIYRKWFKNLVSDELYKRLLCLFPYIIYKRLKANNKNLFCNYTRLIEEIKKHKLKSDDNILIYSGIRESDIMFDENYFADKLCLFSNNKCFKDYRANQNYKRTDFTEFYAKEYINLDKKWDFYNYNIMLYNQNSVFELPKKIQKHVICYNDSKVLLLLNDKILMKEFLKNNNISTPDYVAFNGYDLKKKQNLLFKNSKKIILQNIHGGGGVGTFLFDNQTFTEYKKQINESSRYIVSKYINNSISVNVHVFISENSNIITPASVQIIENIENQLMYRGADFISFRDINKETREKIRLTSIKICNALRAQGYKGVAGLDFIIDKNNNIYCSEINPRFQASSVILSKFLCEKGNNASFNTNEDLSIYKINENAFNNIIKSSISFYDEINYSCYFYYNEAESNLNDIKLKLDLLKKSSIVENIGYDGIENINKNALDKHSYLFSTIFNTKIAQISPDNTLWVNDNVKITICPRNDLELKIALINQGVRINGDYCFKKAVFSGVDYMIVKNKLHINSPVNILFSDISPFEIKKSEDNFYLYHLNTLISKIIIEEQKINFDKKDIAKIRDIIYLSTDRIRIKPINGCDFKSCGLGCKFCELNYSKQHYSLNEISTALEYCKTIEFEHILIGGGTDLSKSAWINITEIAKLAKEKFPDKPISLMSTPIPSEHLKELYAAGVSEVSYNIEIFNKETARKYMPGKRDNNYDLYLSRLKEAVNVFGIGNVRSALVVGLESTDSLLYGIEELCKNSIVPCLSIYRMIPNTINVLNPTNEYLKKIYKKANKIAFQYNLYLGPKCNKCKNNMLSF